MAQMDWEAILRPTPAAFIESVKPWLYPARSKGKAKLKVCARVCSSCLCCPSCPILSSSQLTLKSLKSEFITLSQLTLQSLQSESKSEGGPGTSPWTPKTKP